MLPADVLRGVFVIVSGCRSVLFAVVEWRAGTGVGEESRREEGEWQCSGGRVKEEDDPPRQHPMMSFCYCGVTWAAFGAVLIKPEIER
jgi:hypothetical protein